MQLEITRLFRVYYLIFLQSPEIYLELGNRFSRLFNQIFYSSKLSQYEDPRGDTNSQSSGTRCTEILLAKHTVAYPRYTRKS